MLLRDYFDGLNIYFGKKCEFMYLLERAFKNLLTTYDWTLAVPGFSLKSSAMHIEHVA